MRKGDFTTFIVPKVETIRSLNLRFPKGLLRPVAGKLYLTFTTTTTTTTTTGGVRAPEHHGAILRGVSWWRNVNGRGPCPTLSTTTAVERQQASCEGPARGGAPTRTPPYGLHRSVISKVLHAAVFPLVLVVELQTFSFQNWPQLVHTDRTACSWVFLVFIKLTTSVIWTCYKHFIKYKYVICGKQFKFIRWCSYGFWHWVVLSVDINVSQENISSIFRTACSSQSLASVGESTWCYKTANPHN